MVKLTSTNKVHNESFYFKNDEDCDKFVYVFEDHWCNVKWNRETIPDLPFIDQNIHEDPVKRAEDNLKWGFNSSFIDERDKQPTSEQREILHSLMRKGEAKHNEQCERI